MLSNFRPEDLERSQLSLLDHQMRELEKYRTAVHKMGQDILTLQDKIRDLEGENSRLRRDLAKYNDATRLLMDSQELDGLTKPELAARYGEFMSRLWEQWVDCLIFKNSHEKQNYLVNFHVKIQAAKQAEAHACCCLNSDEINREMILLERERWSSSLQLLCN